jgi:hypothetical protein
VTGGDAAERGVVARAIERVRDRGGKRASGVAWQLRVGVERDHVLHAGQNFDRPDDGREPGTIAAQRRVELLELAALALPSHPRAFARIPLS